MAARDEVVALEKEGEVALVIVNSPPVNALSQAVREGIRDCLGAAIRDPGVRAIVILCEGRTFIAGADIREFGSGRKPPLLRDMQALFDGSEKPIVAAIHGTALGGGLELSLMAHYRLAVPSARCGLPEVNIGILPGGGGTQALPRVVGAEVALEIMTSGRHLHAAEALELGIFDELVPEGSLHRSAVAFAGKVRDVRPIPRVRDRTDRTEADRAKAGLFADFRKAHAARFRGMAAPENIIKATEAAVALPFDEGRKREWQLMVELQEGPQAPAMRYAFFSDREAAKIPDIPADTPALPVHAVGIVGAGTAGSAIAMSFADAGIPVTMVETKQEALDRGLSLIRENRRHLISGAPDMSALRDSDLVIEAVSEPIHAKRGLFAKLDAICKPRAILATSTSDLDIDEIASATGRPESVLGLHFCPPPDGRLVEVVRTDRSAKEAVATAMALAKRIGKVAVVVGPSPGLVRNRILRGLQDEAERLVIEGATPSDVDRVLYDFGFPMGPFAMIDLAGLDTGWTYSKSTAETMHGALRGMRRVPDEEILERCLYRMLNEGMRIVGEKKVIRASDIDVICRSGCGWPVYRGGLIYYGDRIGAANVLAKLKGLEAAAGARFAPAPLLVHLAESNGSLLA